MDITKEELDKKYALGDISKETYLAGMKNIEPDMEPEADKVPFPNRSPASDAFEGKSVGLEPVVPDMNTQPTFTPTDPNLITKTDNSSVDLANKDPNLFPALAAKEPEAPLEAPPADVNRQPGTNPDLIQNSPQKETQGIDLSKIQGIQIPGVTSQMSFSGNLGMGGMPEVKKAYSEYSQLQNEMNDKLRQAEEQKKLDDMALYEVHKNVVETQKKAAKANEDFQNVSQIEPGRYWANASTGAKIGALLASAFGGYAQAYIGGKNAGLDMITKLADDDLNAQVKNYNMLKEKGESANSLYAQMRGVYKDDEQAKLAARLAILHSTQVKMEMSKNKFAAAKSLQELQNEMNKTALTLKESISKNAGLEAVALKYVLDPKSRFDDPKLQNPNYYLNRMKDGKVYSTEVGGHTFHASDDKNAQELRIGNVALNNMKSKIFELKELAKKSALNPTDRSLFKGVFSSLVTDLKEQKALGSLDNGLLTFAKERFAGLTYDNFLTDADKISNSLINGLEKEFVIKANGLFSSGGRESEFQLQGKPKDSKRAEWESLK